MPAQRIRTEAIRVLRFDVLGIDAENLPEFIRHVGLAHQETPQAVAGSALSMVHMGPPLGIGSPSGPISSVGTTSLTADEILQIAVFADNLEGEYESAKVRDARGQYCIAPHVRPYPSEGTVVCLQFNCVGFVIEAYRFANIDLIETDHGQLPLVNLDVLTRQYPNFHQMLNNNRIRERLGIPGDGPWPVVLAGYVLTAMNRLQEEIRSIPYRAVQGDEYFPSRRQSTD